MATMADIARRAGVSVSTVSYALSGKRPISEATRRRVLAAVDDLDFRPNQAARALASRRSGAIALLYPSMSKGVTEMELEFFTSAAEVAGEHGYAFNLLLAPEDDADMLRLVRDGVVDGLILMEVRLRDSRVALLQECGAPFTLIGRQAINSGYSWVDLDFEDAIATAVEHLVDLGHRDIACINTSERLLAADYGPAVRTRDGFQAAIKATGAKGVHLTCDPTPLAAAEQVHALLDMHPNVTGVVSINREAIGALGAHAHKFGLRIPDDLSLAGIVSPRVAQLTSPPMTYVEFPVSAMARAGTELLIRQLAKGGECAPESVLFTGELVIRESTGPAPVRSFSMSA